jgi:hypothetical protein
MKARGRRLCGTTWVTSNIDVTQNVYGKSWWEERVDAVTQAVEAVTNAAQNAEKEEKEEKKNQPESVSNEWVPPLAAPAGGLESSLGYRPPEELEEDQSNKMLSRAMRPQD